MRRLLLLSLLLAPAFAPASSSAVVGGTGASQTYPWMTAVEADGSFICGGTLVAPQLVLTAAHCITAGDGQVRPARSFRVLIGAPRRSQRATGDERAVTRIERHEAYVDSSGFRNDVALLSLDAPSTRQPIALAAAAERPAWTAGKPVRALGWGTQSGLDPIGLTVTDDLREVTLPVVADPDCTSSYGSDFDPTVMVCAGERNGGRDTCQGDSGGPLLVPVGSSFAQVGVVSFGTSCGLPGAPGVYARVGEGALRSWVAARLPAATPAPAEPAPAPTTPTSPPATDASAGCVAARLGVTRTGLPGLRLGKVQNGNGSRCVDGGGRVELRTRRKRLALVVTTARGHRAGSVRVGGKAPSKRTSIKDLRRAPNGVFVLVRGTRVVALAAGDTASRKDLKAFARRVRLAAG